MFTDAYYEGESAYHYGYDLTDDNPYDYHTDEWLDWRYGYLDAQEEDFT